MEFGLLNLSVLFGLGALAVPVVLHLLRRRQREIIDWGAMRFLPAPRLVRRRRALDEWILLLLRLALMALLVVALASPYAISAWLAPLSDAPARDVVLVLDASSSMGRRDPDRPAPWESARAWVDELLAQRGAGDRVALLLARQPSTLVQSFSADAGLLAEKLAALPAPQGNPDLPGAVAAAWRLLREHGEAPIRQVIVLTDRQRFGWADDAALRQWDALGMRWRSEIAQPPAGEVVPEVHIVDVAGARPARAPNFALAPFRAPRGLALAGQRLTFRSALHLAGFERPTRPRRVLAEVDGMPVGEVALPESLPTEGQAPLAFAHRFDTPGRYAVTLRLEADAADDCLPGDDVRRATVEIVRELPVLLVDGDRDVGPESSTFFLRRALAGPADGQGKAALPRAVPARALTDADLFDPRAPDRCGPAVVILADVPRLSPAQGAAVERFLNAGGSLLVFLGARIAGEAEFYNERLRRIGWLPVRLDAPAHAPSEPVRPDGRSFAHPALELFAGAANDPLGQMRFPRWWKVSPAAGASVAARLSNGDPLLVEQGHGKGRVIVCAVPPDRRWGSPLPGSWEFPVLAHELAAYLAVPSSDAAPVDLRESDLRRCDDDDWARVARLIPVPLRTERGDTQGASVARPRHDIWWLLLLAALGLLCGEAWLTRRLARARGA